MVRRLALLASCLGCFLLGCAGSGGNSAVPTVPRSVQYDVALDWAYPLNPKETFYLGAQPIELGHVASANGVTYVGSTLSKVTAIDEAQARILWDKSMTAPVSAGPIVHGQFLFVALGDGAVIKMNAKTGAIVWRYETTVPVEQSLVVQNGVVACVNGNNRLFVLDELEGTVKWRRERPRSNEFTMYGQATPLIHDGVLYAGYSDGNLIAYGLENGTVIWSRDLAPDARFKDLDVQPVIVDNILYAANSSGGLYALDARDGHTIWQRDIMGASSIVPYQGSLYISSQYGLFRVDMETGETLWQNEIQRDALISPIQLGQKYIYASVQRFGLVMVDRASGQTAHVLDMGTDFTSAPLLMPGVLTAISNRSTVYRFFVEDKPVI